ncbi:hypothetical protein DFH07DRAFT_960296 [Mycena maculata]|uniref:Plastocyanin-like domain-containing protein n=1 Tax=Mycena maculata TaxID=230809 RepID=A0AAD7J0C0_9AGAR|nr:hypothetical protein DFH07DRAFT_960296 [Mycena maculata]
MNPITPLSCLVLKIANSDSTASITYNLALPVTDLGTIDAYPDVNDISMAPLMAVPALSPSTRVKLDEEPSLLVIHLLTLQERTDRRASYLDVVDIVVKNDDTGGDPFPIHAHKDQIVERSSNFSTHLESYIHQSAVYKWYRCGTVLEETDFRFNPRDSHRPGGYFGLPFQHLRDLRINANNPGTWFFHCHIEWHLEAGLTVQLIEVPLVSQHFVANVLPIIQSNCQAMGLPVSGNMVKIANSTNLTGLPLGPFPPNDTNVD